MRPFTTKLARLIGRKDFDGAIAHMLAELKGDASDAVSFEMIAHCHQWAGRSDDAIAAWQASLKLDPTSFDVHSMLALMFSEKGEHNEAALHARNGLEFYPEPLPEIPCFILWLFNSLSRIVPRLRDAKPGEAIQDIEKRRAEWFGWAKQYLQWYDATYGESETPTNN